MELTRTSQTKQPMVMELTRTSQTKQPLPIEVEDVPKQPMTQIKTSATTNFVSTTQTTTTTTTTTTTQKAIRVEQNDHLQLPDSQNGKTRDSIRGEQSQKRNRGSGIGGRIWTGVSMAVIIGKTFRFPLDIAYTIN